MQIPRSAIAGLSLSAAGLVGLATYEGYTDIAVIPVKGDAPTNGFGMTHRTDGTPVRIGDRTNPVEALQRTLTYTQKADSQIKQCVTAPLYQAEYDLMSDFGYQYGLKRLCSSAMVMHANKGDYVSSCEGYLSYRFVNGYDCSIPGNHICSGVWKRSKERYSKCMAVQPNLVVE